MTFPVPARPIPQERTGPLVTDVFIFTVVIAVFYGVLMIGRTWFRPCQSRHQHFNRPMGTSCLFCILSASDSCGVFRKSGFLDWVWVCGSLQRKG